MGLSGMSDEMLYDDGHRYGNLSIENLYRHRGYIDPSYGEWESWYAWHPVLKLEWVLVPEIGSHLKLQKWVWRTDLLRRRVMSRHAPYSSTRGKKQWEYTTMMEVLRHG